MAGSAAGAQTPSLLERAEELQRIEEALGTARAGAGALVVIEGPAGIGKTELLSAARRAAAETGMSVAGARGSELERELAFGVARQLVEPFIASADRESRARLFSGAAALAEQLFTPEPPSTAARAESEDRTFAVLHGLHWLFAHLAETAPLVLAVDDAHWADLASLRFLAYLALRREGLPLALVVTSRPAETEAEEELLVRLATDPRGVAISPMPLSGAAVATLLRSGLEREPEPEFVEACHAATGGTPFLVRELIREVRAQGLEPVAAAASRIEDLGPRTIARAVVARVRRLAPEVLGLTRAAAVLGADAEPRRAARLAGVEDGAAAALDALAAAGVITSGRPIEFVHPVLRSAIYAEIPARERSALHVRAAALLDEEGIAEERVASHVLATDPNGDQRRVELLLRTARAALARGAPASAVSYLERALAEPPTGERLVDVLHELGLAEVALGRPDVFVPHFRRAIQACADVERRARIGLEMGRANAYAGDLTAAVAALEDALAELGGDSDSRLAMALEAELLTVALNHYPSTQRVAPRLFARIAQLEAGELDHPELLAALALAMASLRPPARAGADVAERLVREERLELTTWVHGFANALLFAGRLRNAAEYYDRIGAELRSRGWRSALATQGVVRAGVALQQGHPGRAETEARFAFESIKEAAAAGGPVMLAWGGAFLVDSLVTRGSFDEAEAVLERAGAVEEHPPTYSRSLLVAARGHLRLAQGRPAEALADALASRPAFEAVATTAAGIDDVLASAVFAGVNPATRPWGSDAAFALRALDRPEEGLRLAEEELRAAREFDVPHAIGTALRAVAACSEADDALRSLREAVNVLERSEARLELARALVDLGAALRRAKRRKECQEPLRRGLDLAHRSGATPLAERARDELLRTGARPRREVLSGVESLTPSEQRVAELAAEGMTNREIAQTLFVTARTVEGHLTHVYQKLDVGSRGDLAERLSAETANRPAT